LESGHESAQEKGSDYKEQQVFWILDCEDDVLVDQEPGLGPEIEGYSAGDFLWGIFLDEGLVEIF
jgi:hypothetical protein